ncbi:transcriptional repressor LexA [Candidatus Beckwithbacteria bacterium]|nr:transcriptional repressor LexA [Candidatus Beckwithbacteria bacterium]
MNSAQPRHIVTLYKRQRQIIEFISQFIQRNGYSPTLREIGDAMGLSSLATVHEHVERLVDKGVLKKTAGNKTRGIIVVDEKLGTMKQGVNLPILGWIAAGQPIDPYTEPDAYLQVSAEMLSGRKRSFVLQVRGESMIDEGILDGDYVVIEEESDVKDGDIVVAILETGIATLKKIFREATRVRLEPANSSMAPIYATRVQIQGKCVGIIRRFEAQ